MLPSGLLLPTPLVLLVLLLGPPGCSRPVAAPAGERPLESRQPEGVIRLREASRQYLKVEPAARQQGGATLKVPARVAFRDGALSQLAAPLAGRVLRVHVQTGDRVKLGAALVTLDCPEAAAVRTALVTSAASLREARVAFEREKRMLEQGIGTERDKLAAETRLSEVEAEHRRAQAAITFVGTGTGTNVVLRAPLAGTVISRRAMVGTAVQPGGEPIVEIGDPSALWIVASVFERDLQLVREAARVTVELPTLQQPLEGTVTSVGAVVSSGLRTALVRVALARSSGLLRPGMFGSAAIEVAEVGITVPSEAVLIRDGRQHVVYLERDDGTYQRQAVTIGRALDGRIQILSGLAAGSRVVVRGALLLDGAADMLL